MKASYVYEDVKPKIEKWAAIKCLDCKRFLFSKAEVKKHHKNHSVHYTDKEGNIVDG